MKVNSNCKGNSWMHGSLTMNFHCIILPVSRGNRGKEKNAKCTFAIST